ncbi:hypothetical protein PC121_g12398 [Phytophthora cactorum]|nr:hypothetical protein PC121_g12398 [Phytophthora cactorum]KAG4054451.1 hypothetical protein PC123_g10431 [Phytophthora cactorum]
MHWRPKAAPVDSGAPLLELLEAEPASLQGAAEATPSPDSNASSAAEPRIPLPASTETQVRPSQEHARTGDIKRGENGVQSYVNRLLKRVAEPAGATVDLTSHSFRRGGAQHANGDDRLAAQWIFDRGAWDMMKTSKAFAYIANTARKRQEGGSGLKRLERGRRTQDHRHHIARSRFSGTAWVLASSTLQFLYRSEGTTAKR